MLYKLTKRKNPRDTGAPGRYYAYVLCLSELGIDELAERIAAGSTVTRHDCLAVLSALQEQIIYALREGKSVSMGDIGRFRVVARGAGSTTPEDYDTSLVRSLHVCFTPSPAMKDALEPSKVSLERVELAGGADGGGEEEGQI